MPLTINAIIRYANYYSTTLIPREDWVYLQDKIENSAYRLRKKQEKQKISK